MEYSKDIVLGVKFFNGEDKHENLKVEGIRENKYDKVKKIVKKIKTLQSYSGKPPNAVLA